MSRAQMARLFISQRLSAAAEDIFRLFEGIITEYEEQIYLQKKRLDEWTDKTTTDHLRLPFHEEEVPPEEQERNPILVLGEEPELPQIKEELGEHQEVDGGVKSTLTLEKPNESHPAIPLLAEVHAAREERKSVALPSTSTERMKSEPDREDCGVSGPTSVLNLTTDLEPVADVQLQYSDDTEDRASPLSPQTSCQIRARQAGSTRSHFQRPPEMSHPLDSSDHLQSPHCCKVCGESFLSKRSLICHIRVHLWDCGLCGKRLEASESLEVHLLAHKKCNFCGKRFASVTELERHMRTHTGERPFCCPVCGKGFGQKGNMNKHMVSHTGEKPFGCMLCGKVFSEKGNLQKHMRIHTGEKPYGCSSCGKRFNQMPHLKKHKCVT